MVREKQGNLLEAPDTIIAHQVNCAGVMGAGVARQIKEKLLSKDSYREYQELCQRMGSRLLGEVLMLDTEEKLVANLFGEDVPSGGLDTVYPALEKSLTGLRWIAEEQNLSIALPGYLGCGLAGGDWEIVYGMILKVFEESDVDVTIYYIPQSIRMLWDDFTKILTDQNMIAKDWHGFPKWTGYNQIAKWFEGKFGFTGRGR